MIIIDFCTFSILSQDGGGESINGKQADHFHAKGSMGMYLEMRNRNGAGRFKLP